MNGGQDGGYPPSGGQWPNEGSGARGETPYGQDPYGAPGAYGQQPYGQQPYGQSGYGGTQPQGGPYGDPYGAATPSYGLGGEPPKKSRAGLIVGLSVVAVIVVIGAVVAVIGGASGGDKSADASSSSAPSSSPSAVDAGVPHTIRVPRTFGGYHRLTGSVADRLAQTMRKSMSGGQNGKYADVYTKAKIAIYVKGGDTTHPLIFIGLSSSDSPSVAKELKSNSPSEEADQAFVGMGLGEAKDFPPGPLGGVLRCGAGPMEDTSGVACTWADSSTVGIVVVAGTRNVSALAGATLKLRNAAEH